MPWNLVQIYLVLPAFVLVLARVGGLMFTAPLFGSRAIPVRVKALFSVAIAAMIFPIIGSKIGSSLSLGTVVTGMAGELMIGVVMGFSLSLMFTGVQLGGLLVGQQGGIALAQVFNPAIELESTVIGQLYFFVTLMIFLALGGHQALISSLLDSFLVIPSMGFSLTPAPAELVMSLMRCSYGLALSVAGPALVALFLTGMSMGLISRTMPQMNILAVGFVLRVLVAVAATAFTISLMGQPVVDRLAEAFDTMRGMLGLN